MLENITFLKVFLLKKNDLHVFAIQYFLVENHKFCVPYKIEYCLSLSEQILKVTREKISTVAP